MTHIQELVTQARNMALLYTRASTEQALTYACEEIADQQLHVRDLRESEIQSWVENICHTEDIDVPAISFSRKRPTAHGLAMVDTHDICFFGKEIRQSTVLHELAHLSIRTRGHSVLFRDELVRLTRAHISVEYAALLHSLFTHCDLEVAPWPASARRY